jgi:hypothetical protein
VSRNRHLNGRDQFVHRRVQPDLTRVARVEARAQSQEVANEDLRVDDAASADAIQPDHQDVCRPRFR